MPPGRSIPPDGTKTSGPAGQKVTETGSKQFAGGSLGVTVSGATPVSIPGPIPGCGRNGTIYSQHTQPSRACPSPDRQGHLVGMATESSKGHPIVHSSQLRHDSGEHGKTCETHEREPVPHCVGSGLSPPV